MELIESWLRKRDVIQYSLWLWFRASQRWRNKGKIKEEKKKLYAAKRVVDSRVKRVRDSARFVLIERNGANRTSTRQKQFFPMHSNKIFWAVQKPVG